MRTLISSCVVVFVGCSAGGSSVSGRTADLGESTTEVRLERQGVGVAPLAIFGADVGGEIHGEVDLSWALGDGFDPTTRLHQDEMYLLPCGHGTVRFERLVVRGASGSGTIDTATGDLVLTALSDGDVNYELFGTYTPVPGSADTCAIDVAGQRPLAARITGHVHQVKGYELRPRCRGESTAVVVGVGGRMPGILPYPKDATGAWFLAVNARYDAQAPLSLRAGSRMIAQPSADTHEWGFTQPGLVEVVVDTALEVTGARQVSVVTPGSLTALKFDGWIPPNGGHGTSFELEPSPSRVTLTSTTLPMLVPKYVGAWALGVELCQPPPESFYELTSFTPDVCAPVQQDRGEFLFGDAAGVAAKLLRDGRCHVRVGVAGHSDLQTDFTVDLSNVAAAAAD